MKPYAREAWIIAYLEEQKDAVDVLNADFVQDYILATDASFRVQMYGAHKCPQLGRDLSRLAAQRRLKRARTPIEGMAGMGFPTWVWSYRLP